MHPKLTISLTIMVCLLAMFSLASLEKQPRLHYPVVQVESPSASGKLYFNFVLQGRPSLEQCEAMTGRVARVILQQCVGCTVRLSECVDGLKPAQQILFTDAPLGMPSTRMAGGVVTYESSNPALALSACQVAEKAGQAGTLVKCYPSGSTRTDPVSRQRADDGAVSAFSVMFASLWGLVLVLVAVTVLAWRRCVKNAALKVPCIPSPALGKFILAGSDTAILLGTFLLFAWPEKLALNQWSTVDRTLVLGHGVVTFVTVAWFWLLLEHYYRRRPFWDELREVIKVLAIMAMVSGAAAFVLGTVTLGTKHLLIWSLNLSLIPLGRSGVRQILDSLGLWQRPSIIVGGGENALEAYAAIRQESSMGYRVLAFLDVRPRFTENEIPPLAQPCSPNWKDEATSGLGLDINRIVVDVAPMSPMPGLSGHEQPVLNEAPPRLLVETGNLEMLLTALGNPQIIIALDSVSNAAAQSLIRKLTLQHTNVHVIPSLRGLPLFGTELSHFFSHEVLLLTLRNNLARRGYRFIKRFFDLTVASVMVIALSPVFITLATLIRKSGGSAIYGHTRVGMKGQPFKCLKFRSMRMDADKVLADLLAADPDARAEWEKDFKLKNDPRVTPVGDFLRRTSLDELPQLFNVLKGEMSLVGPRPVVSAEIERYGESAAYYMQVRPGITGLWQVSGRNDTTYAERVSLDSWYVKNWSLWYDIAILFKTVDVVIRRKGAY